ncbi:MAG TPA: hypothetical protein VJC02_01115 [Candidatus Paceibacterota bacterium]
MSKRQVLCVVGVWIMVFLFLGVPSFWHKVIAILSGLVIIIIAYNIPSEKKEVVDKKGETFIENK